MTVADWKGALLTLNDGPFFDLMRSYLGDIRTPFNKQRLVEEMEGFLRRRDILETLSSYLDDTDRLVIAAMGTLGEPMADELAGFFEGKFSYAELHAVILNLEERLILYRFSDGGCRRLALNPVLSSILDPISSDPSPLFPSVPLDEVPAAASGSRIEPFDGLFLAAVVAYVRRRAELFRSDGTYRKKTLDDVALAFDPERFTGAVDALHALGVLDLDDSGVRISEARLSSLAALSAADRGFYTAAGFCGAVLADGSLDRKGRLPRDRLGSWARLFKSFAGSLAPDRAYPDSTLYRLLDSAERAAAPRRRRWDSRAADPGAELRGGVDAAFFRAAVLRSLCSAGILSAWTESQFSLAPAPDPAPSSVLSADAAFSVIAYPEIAFADALGLTRFLDIREAGRTARFELCRESAVRGFNSGLSPETMIGILERLSGRSVAQNVSWSLNEWHARYSAVAVHRGVVLTVAEDRRFVMEAPAVSAMVSRVLAPGVYLLTVDTEAEAASTLEKAGLDIVAVPKSGPAAVSGQDDGRFSAFAPLERGHAGTHPAGGRIVSLDRRKSRSGHAQPAQAAPSPDPAALPAALPAAERLAVLKLALELKDLPKDQRDELSARLERRVVLTETQLVGAAVRYEKLEAKGLDYVGKVRVAEQALATGSLVELFWRGPKGEPNRALGVPVSLDKTGGEVALSIDPAPRGERVSVAVGRISLIRRIKRSIFGE